MWNVGCKSFKTWKSLKVSSYAHTGFGGSARFLPLGGEAEEAFPPMLRDGGSAGG